MRSIIHNLFGGVFGFVVMAALALMLSTLIAITVNITLDKNETEVDFKTIPVLKSNPLETKVLPKRPVETFDQGKPVSFPKVKATITQFQTKSDLPALPKIAANATPPFNDIALELDLDGVAMEEEMMLPLTAFEPIYPERARELEVEGYVIVQFTVGPDGRVHDAVVAESVPNRIFNKAAISAIKKFKYKPRIHNGAPVAVRGLRKKFTFDIDGIE